MKIGPLDLSNARGGELWIPASWMVGKKLTLTDDDGTEVEGEIRYLRDDRVSGLHVFVVRLDPDYTPEDV